MHWIIFGGLFCAECVLGVAVAIMILCDPVATDKPNVLAILSN
jgi:hypothetical protein